MSNVYVDLRNEIRDLKRMFVELEKELNPVFYDPIEYIQLIDELEVVLKFKNNYFAVSDMNTLSKALGRININCDSRTLKRLVEDKSRWKELWSMGIETQYMKQTMSGRWVCSDGNILRKNLTAYKTKKTSSFIELTSDDYIVEVNRAKEIFSYFINEEVEDEEIYWIDGNFNNCEVCNLRIKDRSKGYK